MILSISSQIKNFLFSGTTHYIIFQKYKKYKKKLYLSTKNFFHTENNLSYTIAFAIGKKKNFFSHKKNHK